MYIKMATWFVPLLIDILLINALRGHLLGIWYVVSAHQHLPLMPIRLTPTRCPTGRVCKSKTAKGGGRMDNMPYIPYGTIEWLYHQVNPAPVEIGNQER